MCILNFGGHFGQRRERSIPDKTVETTYIWVYKTTTKMLISFETRLGKRKSLILWHPVVHA